MTDKKKILTWLKKCGNGGCSSRCPYDDLGPDKCYETLMTDALELLKENDIELERIYQNICTYINGGCSTDTEADKQHVCEMIGRIFCAGGRVMLTSGVEAQGQWIHNGLGEYHCTICGKAVYLDNGTPMGEGYQYCPFCGARIDEEVEQDGRIE